MATTGTNILTLSDWAKRVDPDGKVATVAELLAQTNDILADMLFIEGNLPTGHRTTMRTGLPTVTWRKLNAGVQPSKSSTAQVDEGCGMLEAYSEVDVELAKLNGNTAAFRLSEAMAFIEALNQEMAGTLIYGDHTTAPEEFLGLTPRYVDLSANNADNIIDGGGTGSDNTSIWLVNWGYNSCHGIFPKGSKAGIDHRDLGEVTVETTAGLGGGRMQAYREHWQWKCGLVLRDWRYVVRICNIDTSNLVAESSAANLIKLMIKAMHRIPAMGVGRPVWYMNRTVAQMLDIQRFNVVSGTTSTTQYGGSIQYGEIDGRWTPSFRGIPIRQVDAIHNAESRVT